MALLRVDFFSDVLEQGTSMTVLLPQHSRTRIGAPARGGDSAAPVLYLLHGLTDDATAWTRYSSIERYASERGLAVVMPQVHRSMYADEAHGAPFWTFLSTELPTVVEAFFRVSQRREDTFVAGLSMGGYGALRWALRRPERFAAAASLSGVLDVGGRQHGPPVSATDPLMHRVFGGREVTGSDDDLFAVLDRADPATLPKLWVGCGTEDELFPDNVRFRDACADRGVGVTIDFGPGDHLWSYWDAKIRDVIAWLPL
ncbi:alpha/beta hydrolase family protein [Solwaraspora sp. WMMD791]|uniref:alpha/beta hydrolase n=1 Tax=Solwaraspora sp. WMMD791 TaxID=3016086 RepID=UPI00249A0E14|nr:alpha/beta hydrolase family protein [Solwaraspora sp. WMMD791]WFE26679.1 alpha/beta hydrolase family protein [Solwaraspora sp. WMMD791]